MPSKQDKLTRRKKDENLYNGKAARTSRATQGKIDKGQIKEADNPQRKYLTQLPPDEHKNVREQILDRYAEEFKAGRKYGALNKLVDEFGVDKQTLTYIVRRYQDDWMEKILKSPDFKKTQDLMKRMGQNSIMEASRRLAQSMEEDDASKAQKIFSNTDLFQWAKLGFDSKGVAEEKEKDGIGEMSNERFMEKFRENFVNNMIQQKYQDTPQSYGPVDVEAKEVEE